MRKIGLIDFSGDKAETVIIALLAKGVSKSRIALFFSNHESSNHFVNFSITIKTLADNIDQGLVNELSDIDKLIIIYP